jgi:hypothetical protein
MRCFACSENVRGVELCWSEGLSGASPLYPDFYPARRPDHGLCGTPGAEEGVRYRGIYKAADGRYRSAGTFSSEERALAVALEAERHAAEVADGAAGGLDPSTRATRTIREYAPLFLRHVHVLDEPASQPPGGLKDYCRLCEHQLQSVLSPLTTSRDDARCSCR